MALSELDLNGYCPKRSLCLCFWKRARFEEGERETDLPVHAHCITSPSSLIFSLFFSVFFLIYFSLLFTLFFNPFFRAQQGPFYSDCRDQCFTVLPLNRLCLVWAYLPTTRSVRHSPLPDRGRFVSFLSIP